MIKIFTSVLIGVVLFFGGNFLLKKISEYLKNEIPTIVTTPQIVKDKKILYSTSGKGHSSLIITDKDIYPTNDKTYAVLEINKKYKLIYRDPISRYVYGAYKVSEKNAN